jgi:methylated-DNA-protein-cysteine methyltransferase related protein
VGPPAAAAARFGLTTPVRLRQNRRMPERASDYERIYAVVLRIPRGRVATYGQIAELAGLRGHARQVGYALHALPESRRVPWHRVINAKGRVSARADPDWEQIQRQLLEREGLQFDAAGRTDLLRYGWRPRGQQAFAFDLS